MKLIFTVSAAVFFLVGCSSSPFEYADSPAARAASIEESSEAGDPVLWGGQIVAAERVDDGTRVLVLAHRLGFGDRPVFGGRISAWYCTPIGAAKNPGDCMYFFIDHPETLALDDFRPGRYITALGANATREAGPAGNEDHPVAFMVAEQVKLWSDAGYPDSSVPEFYDQYAAHHVEKYAGRNLRPGPQGL